ncbi:MAG: hypothetical protein KDK69_02190 [Chlamydiia bacterium]|nr:hypothetical protein [Chlamydiia bacterium]
MSIEEISAVSGDYSSTTSQQMWQQMYQNSIQETMSQVNNTNSQYQQENQDVYQSTGSDIQFQSVNSF